MLDFQTPIKFLKGVGSYYQKKLAQLNIHTLRDLLFYFPYRYEDFSNQKKIAEVKIGEIVTITGKIKNIKNRLSWRKKFYLTEAFVEDDTGVIGVLWFNQPFLINNLKTGDFVSLAGKIDEGKKGFFLINPAYEKIENSQSERRETGRLVPIYSETKGLTSRYLRFLIKKILPQIRFPLDPLPPEIRNSIHLPDLKTAVFQIHFPEKIKDAQKARLRFSFENLFLLELAILKERWQQKKQMTYQIKIDRELVKKFLQNLPFQLTSDQKKALLEILNDLAKKQPMNRLLEGEVGSGKTILAAIASLVVIKNDLQVALMVPTEILAHQHYLNFSKLFKNFDVNIGLLTSFEKKINWEGLETKTTKKQILQKIHKGEIQLIIGTHSLIQKEVAFQKLGLVIIDEQHRFGVEQRAKLIEEKKTGIFPPHLLSLTATPIPRTLALTLWGDLDVSLIKEKPKNRKEVITKIVMPINYQKVYNFVRERINQGEQVFVICPLIEDSLKLEIKSVRREFEKFQKIFPEFRIAILHGKMKAQEKEKIMKEFSEGEINILISTAVVEVGVDVPNATVIIIEGAERFGLAQLYQFRGRVGRGEKQSYCFLFVESNSPSLKKRLVAILRSKNAFELAEKDLQIRGPGEFLGVKQSGMPDYLMEALKNFSLVQLARKEVLKILQKDPDLKNYPLLKEKIEEFRKFLQFLH